MMYCESLYIKCGPLGHNLIIEAREENKHSSFPRTIELNPDNLAITECAYLLLGQVTPLNLSNRWPAPESFEQIFVQQRKRLRELEAICESNQKEIEKLKQELERVHQ